MGLPKWLSGKESACQYRICVFDHWVRKISWRKKWHPTPVFLLGKFHGHRRLVGYNPGGHKESDTAEQMSTHTPISQNILLILMLSPMIFPEENFKNFLKLVTY